MDNFWILPIVLMSLIGGGYIFIIIWGCYKQDVAKKQRQIEAEKQRTIHEQQARQTRQHIYELANMGLELTPTQFMEVRRACYSKNDVEHIAMQNLSGVYILSNKTKNKYYVGQTHQLLNRVNSHFTGKGNGDVYADYKYGDEFTIKIIKLVGSGYCTLNQLEAATIMAYNAYTNGYNKTRGNK